MIKKKGSKGNEKETGYFVERSDGDLRGISDDGKCKYV